MQWMPRTLPYAQMDRCQAHPREPPIRNSLSHGGLRTTPPRTRTWDPLIKNQLLTAQQSAVTPDAATTYKLDEYRSEKSAAVGKAVDAELQQPLTETPAWAAVVEALAKLSDDERAAVKSLLEKM